MAPISQLDLRRGREPSWYSQRGGNEELSGAVFELTPGANGTWTEKVLHLFHNRGGDGIYPAGGVVFDTAGNLYGTTASGGAYGYGTVFELTPSKKGAWVEKILYSFCPVSGCADGDGPYAGVIFDAAGNLYGTTQGGGSHSAGTGL